MTDFDEIPAMRPVVDMDVVSEFISIMGDDVARELLGEFLSDAERQLVMMKAAHASGDLAGFRRGAHTLKSTAGTVGAAPMADLCQRLENAAEHALPSDGLARVADLAMSLAAVRAELVGSGLVTP